MPYKTLIELDKLKEHFHEPMADVARKFGVCTTFFKRICRTYGIKRWPFRKLQSIEKKISLIRQTEASPQNTGKLSQLNLVLEHIQNTGIGPPKFEMSPNAGAVAPHVKPQECQLPPNQPLSKVCGNRTEPDVHGSPVVHEFQLPSKHVCMPRMSIMPGMSISMMPGMNMPLMYHNLPRHPLQQPPMTVPNMRGGLSLLLHDRDQPPPMQGTNPSHPFEARQQQRHQTLMMQQQHAQQQHLQQHMQDAAEPSSQQPTEPKHVELPEQHKSADELQGSMIMAYDYEEEEEDEDEEEEDEEASFILGTLARENLFRHNIATCSSDPENHKACIERFDNIESAAVYIFEIGITGDPQFKYISRGSVDVYGLTPEEVTHPEGCQRILAVIHVEDQASFLLTVQDSRVNLTEWIWRGRSMIPKGAAAEAFPTEYKGIYARSVPTKLADGTVRWEGFLIEVEPAVNGKNTTHVDEPEILEKPPAQ